MMENAAIRSRTGRRWQILDATTVKLIAAALMFLDHVHQMFVSSGAPLWLTVLGRPVFPMFLFISAESFHYTRDKKKYLKRLLFASWGMTLFTFLLQRLLPNPNVVLMNNAFSTFFVAALYMLFWDGLVEGIRGRSPKRVIQSLLCCLIPILCALPIYLVALLSFQENVPGSLIRFLATLALFVPNVLSVEGGFAMVALGLLFYVLRKRKAAQIAVLLLLSAAVYGADGGGIQWVMCFAAIPIALYNGKRGRGLKHFFYIFYPAHIGLLYLLSTFAA